MRSLASVSFCISYLNVEGSTGFLQCLGKKPRKREVEIFNWADETMVSKRTLEGMSALYVPAIPTLSDEERISDYVNTMVLDTANSESRFHPKGCGDGSSQGTSVRIGLNLGGEKAFLVSASIDCEESPSSGRLGVGPHSSLMKSVGKLELTIRDGKYTKLRSGRDVETRGFIFADIVKHARYPEAWAVVGAIRQNNMKKDVLKKVNIIFRTLSRPANINPDTSLYTIYIPLVAEQAVPVAIVSGEGKGSGKNRSLTPLPNTKQESFTLRGDQFFFTDDVTISVNPIVFGYRKDIRMVLDSRNAERPRMAIKVLPKP